MVAKKGLRLWPLVVVVLLAAALLVFAWIGEGARDMKVVSTLGIGLLTSILVLGWWLLFSRLTWRRRLLGVMVFLAVLFGVRSLFEFRGVSGDLVPQFAWRFGARPEVVGGSENTPASEHAAYPGFLGSTRDAHVAARLDPDWEAHPPELVWRRPIGPGCSGFAVVAGICVTQEQQEGEERVSAFALGSGAPLWSHGRLARYDNPIGGVGPRATPTIAGGRVFSHGATGIFDARELSTGELLWSRDLARELDARELEWGVAASPLLDSNRVVVPVGGSQERALVALDAASGETVWAAGRGKASYASPRHVTIDGVDQLLVVLSKSLVAHDPETGAILWQVDWGGENSQSCADAVCLPDGSVVVSTGYGVGAACFVPRREGDGWSVEERWRSRALKAKMSNFVHHEGALYGLDDGVLACVDATTGERLWKDGRYGHGQPLLVGEHLLVLDEFGEVVLIAPSTQGLDELASIQALDGRSWSTPALATPFLVLRNDTEAVCYRLALAE